MPSFRKLTPTELESRGLSRKAERFLNSDTGQLLSKRQYQKAKGIGQYAKSESKTPIKVLAATARHAKTRAVNQAKTRRALQEYDKAIHAYARDTSGRHFKNKPDLRDYAEREGVAWKTFTREASASGAIAKDKGRWQFHHLPEARANDAKGFVGFFARKPDGPVDRYSLILDRATQSDVGRWLNNQERYHNQMFRDISGSVYYISAQASKAERLWRAKNRRGSPVRYLGDREADR